MRHLKNNEISIHLRTLKHAFCKIWIARVFTGPHKEILEHNSLRGKHFAAYFNNYTISNIMKLIIM